MLWRESVIILYINNILYTCIIIVYARGRVRFLIQLVFRVRTRRRRAAAVIRSVSILYYAILFKFVFQLSALCSGRATQEFLESKRSSRGGEFEYNFDTDSAPTRRPADYH